MPNLDSLAKFLWNPLPEQSLLPIENVVIPGPHPTKVFHNAGSPPPRLPRLNAIPKFVLHGFTRMRKAKNTLLGNRRRRDAGPPLVDGNRLMPY